MEHVVIVECAALFYLFLMQRGHEYSRSAWLAMGPIYTAISYIVRELWKRALYSRMKKGFNKTSLLIVTTSDIVEEVVEKVTKNNFSGYHIDRMVIVDQERTCLSGCADTGSGGGVGNNSGSDGANQVAGGRNIGELPVVADAESAPMYVCSHWIDEVLVIPSTSFPYPQTLVDQLEETGVTVHINMAWISAEPGKKQFVERVGGYTVLTSSINYASGNQMLAKRLLGIAGGIVGCLLTGILCLFIVPAIYIQSPGPIFFFQKCVGKRQEVPDL